MSIQIPCKVSNIDITDGSSILSPYFLWKSHDGDPPYYGTQNSAAYQNITSAWQNIFNSALSASFTAKADKCCIELVIYYTKTTSSFRYIYGRLCANANVGTYDGNEFTDHYDTGGQHTERVFSAPYYTHKEVLHKTWILTDLNIGQTYYIHPQLRSSGSNIAIQAGGTMADCILRGFYLPEGS
jgi:hypothetical protein